MKSDTGYLLAGILGLGLGLFNNGNLLIQGLLGVIIIVLFNIFINSDTLKLLINNSGNDVRSFSLLKYIVVNFFIDGIIASVIFIIIRLIIGILLR